MRSAWRWLSADAIRPWNYGSWIFSRDPEFRHKAGRVLDLYEGRWQGQLLEPGDLVVCADEKPSIQARARTHQSEAAKPAAMGNGGGWRPGTCATPASSTAARPELVDRRRAAHQYMSVEPYGNARRVF